MPFIVLSRTAKKEFVRLSKRNQKKVFKKIQILQTDPFSGKKLSGKLKGLFSIRAWPYRIIYEVSRNKIIILHINHRQKAY